jgi:hypothetical protein
MEYSREGQCRSRSAGGSEKPPPMGNEVVVATCWSGVDPVFHILWSISDERANLKEPWSSPFQTPAPHAGNAYPKVLRDLNLGQ